MKIVLIATDTTGEKRSSRYEMSGMTSPLFLFVAAMTVLLRRAGGDWAYSGQDDPEHWQLYYSECGGLYQSPIDIRSGYETHSAHPRWLHYADTPASLRIVNNGHTVQLKGTPANGKPSPQLHIMTSAGVVGEYELDNVHFHWGTTDQDGSEHTFLGRRYPLELHAVHVRMLKGAVAKPEAYVVAAYLFKISANSSPGLDLFLPYLQNVTTNGTAANLPPFPWSKILPEFSTNFFMYKGSVTSPPCPQAANFFIRGKLAEVSRKQMTLFRTLVNAEGDEMSGNWRPTQPRHDRNIYYVD